MLAEWPGNEDTMKCRIPEGLVRANDQMTPWAPAKQQVSGQNRS